MTLSSLILKELSEGQSEHELAKSIGIPKDALNSILAGSPPDNTEVWKKLATYFRMDMDFLRFGELRPKDCHCEFLSGTPTTAVESFRKVPLISWQNIAGILNDSRQNNADNVEGMIETDVHGEHVFALLVKDDSMEPLFHRGETVFVNPDLPTDDEQYVIVMDQEDVSQGAELRQLRKIDHTYLLRALNPAYHDSPLTTRHKIIGRVVRLRMNL